MTKALFKKQMMESFSWLYFNSKNGKRRSGKGILLYGVMYLLIFGVLGYVFYMMASGLCEPLHGIGLDWLYFAITGLVGIVLGVFGSVFNTYASLYQAKDNDLLLSMPVPTSRILMARLSGVYAVGLMYEMIVMIPVLSVWFFSVKVGTAGIVFSLLIPFVMSFFVLTLSCILGWVVAQISARVKNKSMVTVLLSLAFLGGYYYVYFKASQMLMDLIANAQNIAKNVKNILYPLYHMGLAAEGNPVSMLIFTAIVLVFFGIVYGVLEHSFLKLATANRGSARTRYKERPVKAGSADSALLKKELKRFTGSANYMMNCGLGILFMLAASAALVIKGRFLAEILDMLMLYAGGENIIPLLLTAALCMLASMNDISAPSVSLEGKNIWLAQVLPVSSWKVLKAKLKLHLLLTLPPVLLLTVCVLVVFRPEASFLVLIPLTAVLFVFLMAMWGLFLNLKAPNLNWTSEVVPIKQSLSVTLTLFGGWGIVMILGGVYFLVMKWLIPAVFLMCTDVLMLAANAVLFRWLKTGGSRRFEQL